MGFRHDYASPDENFEVSGKIQNQKTSWGHDQSQNKLVSQALEKEQEEEEEQKEFSASYLLGEELKAFKQFMKNLHEE